MLKILARRGPLHGYGITVRIQEISEDVLRVEEGSLYPALHRMEEAGWIKAKWLTTENKRRARVYEITADGRRAARGRREALDDGQCRRDAGAEARLGGCACRGSRAL